MKKSILLMVALCSVSLMAEPVRLGGLGPDTMIETRGVTASVVTGIVETATESFVGIKQVGSEQRLVDAHDSPISGTILFSDINSNAYARVLSGNQASIPIGWNSTLRSGYGYEARLAANMYPYIYLKSPPSNLGLQSFLIKDINEKPFRFYSNKQENRAVWTSPFTPWGADSPPSGVGAFGDAAVSNLLVLVWGSADGENYVMTSADGWFTYVAATNASSKMLSSHKLANNPHNVTPAQIGAITTNQLDTALEGIVVAESDPVAYPVATNALALAEGALQADATNGLPVAVAHAESAHGLTDNGGFAGGDGASAQDGGAVGYSASAQDGGAVGYGASAQDGGAVGYDAMTSSGFAGGYRAMAALDNTGYGTPIDAIQLGTGWNPDANTLQIYGHKLMNADGSIPAERMAATLSGYATTGAVAAVQAEVAAGTNWLTRTGLSGTVEFANDGGRPQAWSGTGALTVSGFSGLTPPSQVYWTMSGFSSVTLPAGVYAVGGGSWQANMVNHFTLWQTGTNVLMSFITATED